VYLCMTMSMPLKTTSLPQAVYDALRESIVTVQDAPGSVLTETAVAARFGVARPTAKAAIERLVAEGLLVRRAHHAAAVPQLSRADIVDLYSSRAVIEEAALRGLDTVPASALAAHREVLAYEGTDSAPFARADITFHRELVLAGEIELCIGQVLSQRLLSPTEVAQQHQGILDAVASGDRDLAARLTREHIEGARDKLLERFDASPSSLPTQTEG
jgi:DNA-binding GntR family transcriptional regulator